MFVVHSTPPGPNLAVNHCPRATRPGCCAFYRTKGLFCHSLSFSFCICLSKGSPREHKYMSLGFPRRRGSFGLRCADIFSILSRVRDLSSNAMILLVNHYPKKRAIIMVIILPRPHTHTPHQCPCQGDTPNVSKAHLLGNHFQRKSASLFAFMAVRAHDDDRVGAA